MIRELNLSGGMAENVHRRISFLTLFLLLPSDSLHPKVVRQRAQTGY